MDGCYNALTESERGRLNREIGEEIWRRKKEDEERRRRDSIVKNSLQGVYWPFGRPGGGAPNRYTVRRQKLSELLQPSRIRQSDGPLPHLPMVRRRFKYSDPELRYQYHPDVRRSTEIHWRYGVPPQITSAYRMELERQMEEKRRKKADERRAALAGAQRGMTTEFGRAGPGGLQWRHPSRIGMNFLHSLGWTGEKAFRRLEDQMDGRSAGQLMIRDKPHDTRVTPEEALTGGVELVPLMARRRSFKKSSHLLSCDVTNTAMPIHAREAWQDTCGPVEYLRDLDQQVTNKKVQVKAEKEEDVRSARRHFDTWNSLWGRPGHGAPREGGVKGKGHLGKLLYREPGVLWPGTGQKIR